VCTKSGWTSSDPTKCESDVQGLELNTDGFKWCYTIHWLMTLQTVELENLSKAQVKTNEILSKEFAYYRSIISMKQTILLR